MNKGWRSSPPPSRRLCLLLLGAALFVSGCKFNLDIKIPGVGALICVKVKAKNASDEAAIRGQVQKATLAGNAVEPTFQPVSGPDAEGFNIWILKVQFRAAEGGNGGQPQTVHLGIELKDGADWTHIETTTADLPHPTTPQVRRQGGAGPRALSLTVENASGTELMRVDQLEVACAPVDIELEVLNYTDPQVTSLPWFTVIASSTIFQPGEVQNFVLPVAEPGSLENCFMRALYTDENGLLGPLGVVGQLNGEVLAVPTLSGWGLAVLLVAISIVTLVLLRRRRLA